MVESSFWQPTPQHTGRRLQDGECARGLNVHLGQNVRCGPGGHWRGDPFALLSPHVTTASLTGVSLLDAAPIHVGDNSCIEPGLPFRLQLTPSKVPSTALADHQHGRRRLIQSCCPLAVPHAFLSSRLSDRGLGAGVILDTMSKSANSEACARLWERSDVHRQLRELLWRAQSTPLTRSLSAPAPRLGADARRVEAELQ